MDLQHRHRTQGQTWQQGEEEMNERDGKKKKTRGEKTWRSLEKNRENEKDGGAKAKQPD